MQNKFFNYKFSIATVLILVSVFLILFSTGAVRVPNFLNSIFIPEGDRNEADRSEQGIDIREVKIVGQKSCIYMAEGAELGPCMPGLKTRSGKVYSMWPGLHEVEGERIDMRHLFQLNDPESGEYVVVSGKIIPRAKIKYYPQLKVYQHSNGVFVEIDSIIRE